MKKKDIETKILSSLEESKQALNPHILDAARNEMREKHQLPIKRKLRYKYAVVIGLSFILCLAITLPILFVYGKTSDNQNAYTELEYSSLYDYFKEENIKINTYDHLLDKNMDLEETHLPSIESPYKAGKCVLGRYKETDIYIKQTYSYYDTDIITVSVLLIEDETVKNTFFGDFLSLEKSTRFMRVDIRYFYDDSANIGKAEFIFNEKEIFIELACDSEVKMLTHIQAFLISQ